MVDHRADAGSPDDKWHPNATRDVERMTIVTRGTHAGSPDDDKWHPLGNDLGGDLGDDLGDILGD